MKKKRFQLGGSFYEIPENEISSFLQDNPKAIEVKFYDIKGSKYNIPVSEVDAFEIDMGLKKKDLQPVSQTGGKAGTSVLPSGLTPSKIEVKEYKEPIVGEDTMLTRKMERAQKQAISGTEVRLPAAPKAVAAERGMQRAIEPMVEKPTAKQEQSWLSNTVSALDRGFYKNLVGNPIKGLGTLLQYGTAKLTGGTGREVISDALIQFGDYFNKAIDEVAPQDESFKGSLSDQFAQALGQVGSIVITGGIGAGGKGAALAEQAIPKAVLTGGAGKVAPAIAATKEAGKKLVSELATPATVSAGLTVGQSEFDRAKQAGASDDQAFEAFYKNAAVGSILEKVPVMQFFKRFNNATQGGIVNYLKTKGVGGLTGGLEEATTEVLQQVYANKTAKDIYNANQDIFEGLTESGGIGFGVGFLLNAMGANAKILRKQGKEAEAQLVDAQIKEFQSRAEKGPEVPPAPSPVVEEQKAVIPTAEVKAEEVVKPLGEVVTEAEAQVPSVVSEETLNKYLSNYKRQLAERRNELIDQGVQDIEADEEIKNIRTRIKNTQDKIAKVGEVAPEAVPEVPATAISQEVADLRANEQAEYAAMDDPNDEVKRKEIYDKYDKLITPLLEKEKEVPAAPEVQKESIQNAIKQEGIDISSDQLDRLYDEVVKGGGKVEESQIRKILNVGYLRANQIAEQINELGVGEVAPEVAPQVPAAPEKAEPIRQLGTGANVYFENENYRVNDFRDKVLLNVSKAGDAGIVVNLEFNNPEEAVDVAKTLNRLYPQGVPEAVLLDKVVEDIKAGKYKEVVGEVAIEAAPEIPEIQKKSIEASEIPKDFGEVKIKENSDGTFTPYLEVFIKYPTGSAIVSQPIKNQKNKFLTREDAQKAGENDLLNEWNKSKEEQKATVLPVEEELPFGETAPREAAKTKEEQNLTKRALNLEVSTPRAEVLQYFISGGKISPEALTEFFGKERRMGMGKIRVEERRSRTSLTNKNAPSIEALAEKIAGTDRLDQVQEYREAIEEALLNHSGTKTMAEELVRDYDFEFAEMKRAAELEELGQEIEAEVQAFVSQIPPAQQEEIMRVLDKFRDNDGFIDWKKIDEETKFGFEPVLLELSEPSQKIINDAIKQFEETGRVGRISPEVISEKEVKEVKPETYAIQEPTAGEVPVQPEAGVSEEVEGGVPPTEPPTTTEEGKAEGEEREMTGISNAETEKMRLAMGIPEFERPEPETWEQLNEQADEAIKKGYNIEQLLTKIENGNIPNSLEVVILSKYGAALSKKFDINQDKEVLKQYERFTNATNSIGTIAGRSFNARKTLVPKEDTLADFFVLEKEETGVDELTEEQQAILKKEYNEIKAATEALQKKVEQLQEENARMLAGEVVTEERKKAKKTRKTSQDFAQERKQIVDDIRQKLKEARQQSKVAVVPYLNELIAISPDVAKLVKSLVEQGVIKLEDIVTEIHATLKEDIEGLTKKDVTDLIAGEYNRKKPTRGAIAEKIKDLKDEAKLITKLEKLQEAPLPKDPIKKIERSREIKQLKDKIKEHPNTKLSEAKTKIATQIKKLEKDLADGNYDKKPEKREVPLDKEGKELQKKLIQLRRERDIRRLKNEYEKRNKLQKAVDKVTEIANIPRSLMASTDFSAPLNQAIVATIAYPDLAKKATEQMIKATASQEAFDQWFYDLKDDPRYDLMKELKLRIADPHSPFLTAREEAFMSGYAEQIPGLGRLVKASERAYVQYLNKLRVDIFNRFVDRFEEQGKTYANSPKLYEATAKYINNITGSGKLPKIGSVDFEQFSPMFSALLFSPRLMAARINMLNPYYFATLPTELKVQYGKDMGKFLGLASTIITLFALYGKTQDDDDEDKITVETDPTSTDFARIKQGDTRWDILGGFQPYIRLMNQIGSGERKSTKTGLKQSLDGEGAFGMTRGDVLASFFRNKLAPVPSMTVNFIQGRNSIGEKVTLEKELFSHVIPLSMQTIGEAIKEGGPSKVVSAGLPAVFGIGVQTYGDRPKEVKEEIEYRNREVKLTKEQKNFFQDVYDEISKKNLDKLKASKEYKSVARDVQVDLENIVKKAAMKKAEKRLTEKYAKEFLKFPVIQEDRKVKSIKEKVKSQF